MASPRRPRAPRRSPLRWALAAAALLVTAAALVHASCALHTRSEAVAESAPAPAFALPDPDGTRHSLAQLTRGGAALIVFYRGHW